MRNLTPGRDLFQGEGCGGVKLAPRGARTWSQTSSGERTMLRTIFMIGLFAIGGLFVLRLAFGLFGVALGIFGVLLALAIKVAIIGGLIYLVIRIFSPDTARRLRQKWSGSSY